MSELDQRVVTRRNHVDTLFVHDAPEGFHVGDRHGTVLVHRIVFGSFLLLPEFGVSEELDPRLELVVLLKKEVRAPSLENDLVVIFVGLLSLTN